MRETLFQTDSPHLRPIMKATLLLSALLFPAIVNAESIDPIPYKTVGERKLMLHIDQPDDRKPGDQLPAIVFFFGGGWVGGSPKQFEEHAKYFATRGMVGIRVDYRTIDKKNGPGTPDICIEDAKAAIRYVRKNATELGIDPDRIAASGGSAGGHLAAATALVPGFEKEGAKPSSKPNALVLFNPVLDNGPDDGWGHSRVGDDYKKYSPAHNITKDAPPAIVFLGTKDKLIPVSTMERFRDNMKKADVRCELHLWPDGPHGYFNHGRDGNKAYLDTVTKADKFLAALDWLKGEPTL